MTIDIQTKNNNLNCVVAIQKIYSWKSESSTEKQIYDVYTYIYT